MVSLYPGLGVKRAVGFVGTEQPPGEATVALGFGSVLMLGYRSLPLVQVHLTPEFSLDAHALWAVAPATGAWYDKYLAGFTWDF